MVHYSLNKIKLAFDVQYKTAIVTFLTYLLSGLGLILKDHWLWHWPQKYWPWTHP